MSENGAPRKLTLRGQTLIVRPVDLGGKFGRPDYSISCVRVLSITVCNCSNIQKRFDAWQFLDSAAIIQWWPNHHPEEPDDLSVRFQKCPASKGCEIGFHPFLICHACIGNKVDRLAPLILQWLVLRMVQGGAVSCVSCWFIVTGLAASSA